MPGGPCQALVWSWFVSSKQGGNVPQGNLGKQCTRRRPRNGRGLREIDHRVHIERYGRQCDRRRSPMTWKGGQVRAA